MNILIVEDNQADAKLLKEFIEEKYEGTAIDWVTDGHQAVDYVFKRNSYTNVSSPDLILLDLGLPRISGYEVLKQLKDHPSFIHIPVIVLTTSRNPLDRSQCESLGANAFYSKPYDLKGYEELLDTMFTESPSRFCPIPTRRAAS